MCLGHSGYGFPLLIQICKNMVFFVCSRHTHCLNQGLGRNRWHIQTGHLDESLIKGIFVKIRQVLGKPSRKSAVPQD